MERETASAYHHSIDVKAPTQHLDNMVFYGNLKIGSQEINRDLIFIFLGRRDHGFDLCVLLF